MFLILVFSPLTQAAGYYNLGAFWRTPVSAASCATPTLVQIVPSGGGYTDYIKFQTQNITQTAGNAVIAIITGANHGTASFAMSDTLGNTWYAGPIINNLVGYNQQQIFYALNIPGGANTVTVTQSGGDPVAWTGLMMAEYTGIATTDAVDIYAGRTATGNISAISSGSMTLNSNCKELVIGDFVDNSASIAPGAGWTQVIYDGGGQSLVEANTPGLSAIGATVNAAATLGGNDNYWSASQIAFRVQGSAGFPAPHHLAISSAPQNVAYTWQCSGALTIQSQDAGNNPARAHTPIPVGLTASGSAALFSDSTCSTPISSTMIYAGTSAQTVYFRDGLSESSVISATATGLVTSTQTETISGLDPFTWVGGNGGCDGKWATAACWQGGSMPGSGDIAQLDTHCSTHCSITLGANATVGGVLMHPGTNISLDLNTHDLMIMGTLYVEAGTLNASSGNLTARGDLGVSGGTVTLSGTVSVQNNFGITGGTVTAPGTLQFIDVDHCNVDWLLQPGTVSYNNVVFMDDNLASCSLVTRTIVGNQTMAITGNLSLGTTGGISTFWGGLLGGTIALGGDLIVRNQGYYGSTNLTISGSGNQNLDAVGAVAAYLPNLTIASSGGTVMVKGNPIFDENFTYTSGNVDFVTHGAVVTFDHINTQCSPHWDLSPGGLVFGDVQFLDSSLCGDAVRTMTGSMSVNGTLTIGAPNNVGVLNGGTINALKDVVVKDLGYKGTTNLNLAGTGAQLLDVHTTSNGYLPTLTLAGTAITFKGMPIVSDDYTYTSGTVDFATNSAGLQFNEPFPDCSQTRNITPGNVTYGPVRFFDESQCGPMTRNFTGTMTVDGTLTIAASYNVGIMTGGTIVALQDVVTQDKGYQGSTQVQVGGSISQSLDASTSGALGYLPGLTLASTGGPTHPITFVGNPIVTGSYAYTSGTVDFTTNSSILSFAYVNPTCSPAYTISPGAINYGSVSFLDDSPCGPMTRTLDATMNINGNLVLGGANNAQVLNGGALSVTGNVQATSKGNTGTTQLIFTGTSPATITVASGASMLAGNVTVSKPGTTLTLGSNVSFNSTGQKLTLTDGTILMSGKTLKIKSTLTVGAGTTITEGGTCSTTTGTLACTGSGGSGTPAAGFAKNNMSCGTGTLVNNGTITCP